MPPEASIDAVEWKEPAPDGGSQAQIFRLADGRTALVKFAENVQGPGFSSTTSYRVVSPRN
jgi:hypothetical protein